MEYDLFFATNFNVKQNYSSFKYPTNIQDLGMLWAMKYKVLVAPSYFILHIILGAASVMSIFPRKTVLLNIIFIYSVLIALIIVLIVFGLIIHSYKFGFGAAQNVKIIVNSPILPMLILLYYWKINPQTLSKT
jgi:hypothetical protein